MSIINDTTAIGRRLAELQGKSQPEQQPALGVMPHVVRGPSQAPAPTPEEIQQHLAEMYRQQQQSDKAPGAAGQIRKGQKLWGR